MNQTACNMAQKLSFFARVSRFHFHSISLCENVNYGSDSLAALSPSFGRDFHIHYIISGTMIIAVILSVSCVFFSLQLFQAYQLFLYVHFMLFKSKRIFTVQMKTLKQIQKCHRKIKRKKIESEAEKKIMNGGNIENRHRRKQSGRQLNGTNTYTYSYTSSSFSCSEM